MKQSQSVLDALADAETLRLNDCPEWGAAAIAVALGSNTAICLLGDPLPAYARSMARQAAHAAFIACPELRG